MKEGLRKIYSLSFAVVLEYYKNMFYLYENNN